MSAAQPPGRRGVTPMQAPSVWMVARRGRGGAITSCPLPEWPSEALKKVFALTCAS
jgi:hypothetical protein